MPPPKSKALEGSIATILNAHFENHENPHETIYQIWLLLHPANLEMDAAYDPGHDRLH